ncbi:MAG: hypothetical protein NVS2B16_25290 [Chloroflexota bacterium]
MAAHVRALCEVHGIRVLERMSYGGVAWKSTRTIAIKPIKTQRTYIVALHEIGHIVGRGRSGTRLEQEAAAWAFVIAASVIPLSASTYRRMYVYLRSYLEKAQRSRRMHIPAPGQEFWAIYAIIDERAHNRLAS